MTSMDCANIYSGRKCNRKRMWSQNRIP